MGPVSPTIGRFASIFIEENLGSAVDVSAAQLAEPRYTLHLNVRTQQWLSTPLRANATACSTLLAGSLPGADQARPANAARAAARHAPAGRDPARRPAGAAAAQPGRGVPAAA